MTKSYIRLLFLLSYAPLHSYAEDTTSIIPSSVYNMALPQNPTKKDAEENKPRLENYASYDEFINAMYIYNRSQEDNIKPRVIIDLPTKPDHEPEYTFLENNADVTGKGETIPDPTSELEKSK